MKHQKKLMFFGRYRMLKKHIKVIWNEFFVKSLVMKFHDRCIRKSISRHCLDKTCMRWNDFLFLITRWSRFSSSNMKTMAANWLSDAPIMKFHHQRKQVSTCIILVLKEVKFLTLQRNYFSLLLNFTYTWLFSH
jgi:hypothetical protein